MHIMKFTTTLFTLASTILAAPASNTKALVARSALSLSLLHTPLIPYRDTPATIHLYICADAGFKGTCENLHLDPGKCCTSPSTHFL